MNQSLTLTVQDTPNPNAVKFTLNRVVATQGVTYRDAAQAPAGWASRVLALAGVTQAFALQNFVSVTKAPTADWETLGPQVAQVLREEFS